MKRKLLTRARLGLAALALAGCSEARKVDTWAGDYEEALCGWASECGAFTDRLQCRAALVWDDQLQYLVTAAEADRVDFDATAAQACLDAIAVLPCDGSALNAVLFSTGPRAAPEPCQAVFTGKVRNYDPCLRSEECAGDNAVCGFSPMCMDACCAGACRDLGALPAIGEACTGSCAGDAFCAFDPDNGTQVCQKRLAAGRSCAGNWDGCEEGLFCDSSGDGSAVCRKLLGAGEACQYDGCGEGLVCYQMGEASECRTLPDEGEECWNCNYPSCARIDNTCEIGAGGNVGTCVRLPEIGQSCEQSYACVPYAECAWNGGGAATCQARGVVGEACGEPNYISCLGNLECDFETYRCVAPETKAACDSPK